MEERKNRGVGEGVERTEKEESEREDGREEVTLWQREIDEVKEDMRGEERKRERATSERERERRGRRRRRGREKREEERIVIW